MLFEHHAVRAHTKIAGSVLRESEQEFISLLATERRLFRLRAIHTPDRPLLFLDGDKDAVEELAYASASGVTVRTQRRKGQILAGLVIAGFAVLGYSWLQITGTALFLLGIAGALHGLLLPTRWAEVLATAARRLAAVPDLGLAKKERPTAPSLLAATDTTKVEWVGGAEKLRDRFRGVVFPETATGNGLNPPTTPLPLQLPRSRRIGTEPTGETAPIGLPP